MKDHEILTDAEFEERYPVSNFTYSKEAKPLMEQRINAKLTLREMSLATGISISALSEIEHGKVPITDEIKAMWSKVIRD